MTRGTLARFCAAAAALPATAAALAQPCEPHWVERFPAADLNKLAGTLTVIDDGSGSGPALYAGGLFTVAGNRPVNHVARFDGRTWFGLGNGLDKGPSALLWFDDGSGPALYATGSFTASGASVPCRSRRPPVAPRQAIGTSSRSHIGDQPFMIIRKGQQYFLVCGESFLDFGPFRSDRAENDFDGGRLAAQFVEYVASVAFGVDRLDRNRKAVLDGFDKDLNVGGDPGLQGHIGRVHRDFGFIFLQVRVEPAVLRIGDNCDLGDFSRELAPR